MRPRDARSQAIRNGAAPAGSCSIRGTRLGGSLALPALILLIALTARGGNPLLESSKPSPTDAAAALVAQLGDPDPAVREQAQDRLENMGAAARPALLRGVRHASPEISTRSQQILETLPWDTDEDAPAVRTLLRDYGQRETSARVQVARQLFGLPNGAGYPALARLIVEDSEPIVQWRIAQSFREGAARLSPAQIDQLALASDNPAAVCLTAWSCEKDDFPRAVDLYDQAIRLATERNEPCVEGLSPVFDTLVGFRRFKQDYEAAAQLLRTRRALSLRESGREDADTRPVDDLFALHAMHGPLSGFASDLGANVDSIFRPALLYSLGRMCQNHRALAVARIFYALAYLRGTGSPETREDAGEFLMEQNWSDLAERELQAITQSWFAGAATIDSARMRLGLLHSNLGDDEAAARYLAQALPGLHTRSVWLSIQRGERRYYGRGAEKYLWTLQHFHALRFAVANHRDDDAEHEALELVKLAPDDPTFVMPAVPILKATHHAPEAAALFEPAYDALRKELDESPDNPHCLNNLAWMCAVCREKLDDALGFAQRAVSIEPRDPNIMDTLAEVYLARGEKSNAIATVQKALELNPGNAYLKKRLEQFDQNQ